MKVYLDVLFLMNFIMDFLIISITADIMSVKIRAVRSILSAAVGAISGILFFCFDLPTVFSFFLAGLMSALCFLPCKTSELIKRTLVMYLASGLIAGIGLLDMMVFGGGVIKNGIFYASSFRIIIIAALIYLSSKFLISRLKRRAAKEISGVILEYNGKRVHTSALTDTGNGLYDPISRKPVVLIELDILKALTDKNCTTNNISEWIEKDRIKLIPYRTIDNDGYLTGIKLDRIYIDGRCIDGAIAAVCGQKLSYPVILHAGI